MTRLALALAHVGRGEGHGATAGTPASVQSPARGLKDKGAEKAVVNVGTSLCRTAERMAR